ncbi:MAG: T9SS type A sorting domain-containing protein [Paludibacteraceae bacterium]
MKRSIFIFLWLVAPLCLGVMATNLVVKPLSGADYRRELATIGKVAYHGDSLYLYDSFGTLLYHEQLTKVQRLIYSEGGDPTTGVEDTQVDAGASVRVFPNPTKETLVVEGMLASDGQVRLYNQQGQLVQSAAVGEGRTTLDVSGLPAGSYLLICEGGVFKVIKE